MTLKTNYQCKCCGMHFSDKLKCFAHEATHYGLTQEEYRKYKDLKDNVLYRSSILIDRNEDFVREDYNRACKELVDFEIKHGLKGTKNG